jgi:hypothetical protein
VLSARVPQLSICPVALDDGDDADALDDVAEAVADEDRRDLVEARDAAHHRDRFPQHQPAPVPPGSLVVLRRTQGLGERAEHAARDEGEALAELAGGLQSPRAPRRTKRP